MITATVAEDAVIDGVEIKKGMWVIQTGLVKTRDGKWFFHVPEPVAFYLIEAAKHRDMGEKSRVRLLESAFTFDNGVQSVTNPAMLDAIAHLTIAVQFSLAAVEAHANGAITDLPDDATVDVERAAGTMKTLAKPEMERGLSLDQKLQIVMPLVGGKAIIKSTKAWQGYRRISGLRNDLVHLKHRGHSQSDTDPGPFDVVVRGDGSTCVEDAIAVIDATQPDWISERVRSRVNGR